MVSKDEIIRDFQNEKPEHLDMERRQAEEELTAEQEDYMLESAMETERELRNPTELTEQPSSFSLTIQRLRKEKEEKGWTSVEFFDRVEQEADSELAEYKKELELSYGID